MKPTLNKEYPEILLGINHDNQNIYLTPPSWDFDWYWSFGYIGNDDLHIHLSDINKYRLIDGLSNYFKQFIITDTSDKYLFCELVETIYHLKIQAEFYSRGGMNYTQNPLQSLFKKETIYTCINHVYIPEALDTFYKLLEKYQ